MILKKKNNLLNNKNFLKDVCVGRRKMSQRKQKTTGWIVRGESYQIRKWWSKDDAGAQKYRFINHRKPPSCHSSEYKLSNLIPVEGIIYRPNIALKKLISFVDKSIFSWRKKTKEKETICLKVNLYF